MNTPQRVISRQVPTGAERLAAGLGWFSVALGVAELLAPRSLSRGIGLGGRERLVAGYGLREIVTGVGILASRQPAPWLWGRVAGDALDLATLAAGAVSGRGRQRSNAALGALAVAGVTLLDLLCAQALSREHAARTRARARWHDYGDRVGMRGSAEAMRGVALRDFEMPRDFAIPPLLRPWRRQAAATA